METKNKNLYDENSIESLSPLAFTRLRPGVYAGDTTYSTQLLVEIFSNAVDEFRLGHGSEIDVKIDNDGVITLRDYGQGFIPNSFREDGKSILEALEEANNDYESSLERCNEFSEMLYKDAANAGGEK